MYQLEDKKKKMTRENTTRGKLPLKGQEQNKHFGEQEFVYFVVGVVLFRSVFKGGRNGAEMKTARPASPRGKSYMSMFSL